MTHPEVAIAIRQRHPKTITEAVQATIELETYLPARESQDSSDLSIEVGSLDTQIVPNLISNEQSLVGTIGELVSRIKALEGMLNYTSSMSVMCRKCGQPGHYARGCASGRQRNWA